MSKAQVSIEFIGIVTFMFFVFVTFFALMGNRMVELKTESDEKRLIEMGDFVRQEIELAASVENGYSRTFKIPEFVEGKKFNFTLHPRAGPLNVSVLIVTYTNYSSIQEYVIKLPGKVNGTLEGYNNITKQKDVVCINLPVCP